MSKVQAFIDLQVGAVAELETTSLSNVNMDGIAGWLILAPCDVKHLVGSFASVAQSVAHIAYFCVWNCAHCHSLCLVSACQPCHCHNRFWVVACWLCHCHCLLCGSCNIVNLWCTLLLYTIIECCLLCSATLIHVHVWWVQTDAHEFPDTYVLSTWDSFWSCVVIALKHISLVSFSCALLPFDFKLCAPCQHQPDD